MFRRKKKDEPTDAPIAPETVAEAPVAEQPVAEAAAPEAQTAPVEPEPAASETAILSADPLQPRDLRPPYRDTYQLLLVSSSFASFTQFLVLVFEL